MFKFLSGDAGESYSKSGKNITFFILPQRFSSDLFYLTVLLYKILKFLSGGAGESYSKSGKNITFFILPQRFSSNLYFIFI